MLFACVLVAAGEGRRLGSPIPKAFVDLEGRSLLVRSLEALLAEPRLTTAVVVVPAGYGAEAQRHVDVQLRHGTTIGIAFGGRERQQSVQAGLAQLPDDCDIVLVHDAARPFVRSHTVAACLDAALARGAVTSAVQPTDTVKEVDPDGAVVRTLDRGCLRLVQTPQAFRLGVLRRAHAEAEREGFLATDDAALVERYGSPVWTVPGDADNLKITTRADLDWARWRLRAEPR
jgi:2-C-methyl-D-erythritol 4-phosphate cytidylyltransferase